MSSSNLSIFLATYLSDTEDAEGTVDFIRSKWPKSLATYLSGVKSAWMTLNVHRESYETDFKNVEAQVKEMLSKSKGKEKTVLRAASKKLTEFNNLSLTDKNKVLRSIKTHAYSGHALVDDALIGLKLFPEYMDKLRISDKEVLDMQRKSTRSLEEKSINSFTVQASDLIAKCVATMSNDTSNAFDVACAIALTTGRRMIEIFKTGIFTEVEERRMLFGGQAKRACLGEDTPYMIPVLAPANIILTALNRLRRMKSCANVVEDEDDEKFLSNKVVNQKWSNSCNSAARRILGASRHFHDLRSIYAVIAFNAALPHKWSQNAFISRVLGHAGLQNSLSYSSIHIENLVPQDKFVWKEAC